MGKSPRYFCEFCGVEVGKNAKICPKCGKFFSSVRCPKCGFSGRQDLFVSGCPECGYSGTRREPGGTWNSGIDSPPLPLWIFIAVILALGAAVALVVFTI